jgi:hypothetical protein
MLRFYNIPSEAMLHLVLRIRGGSSSKMSSVTRLHTTPAISGVSASGATPGIVYELDDASRLTLIQQSVEQHGPLERNLRVFYSSLRSSEELTSCRCNVGWLSFGCSMCCACCTKHECVSCEFHAHAARWATLQKTGEGQLAWNLRASEMMVAVNSKVRITTMWLDVGHFRASIGHVRTPPRKRIANTTGTDTLRSFSSSFEASQTALYSEVCRSLTSRVVPPRVVELPLPPITSSTGSSSVFCVAPICLLPSDLVASYEAVCQKAPRARYKVTRGLSLVTIGPSEAGHGDRFVFNDSDPGAAQSAMTPSLVILRTVETKVR